MTDTLPERSPTPAKNRVVGSPLLAADRVARTARKPPETASEITVTVTVIVSGLPFWLSRDPIEEKGGIPLYVYCQNDGVNSVDPFGEFSISEFRDALWQAVGQAGYISIKMLLEAERKAPKLSAPGVEGGVSWISGTGEILGFSVMFFPESCEIAAFGFVAGPIGPESMQQAKDRYFERMQTFPVGFNIGASVEAIRGWPRGSAYHDADSWRGWFVNMAGSGGPVAGSYFESDDWRGFGIGPSAGLPGGSGALAYYDWFGGGSTKTAYQIDNWCLCNLARVMAMNSPEAMQTLLKSLRNTL